ncbi:bolA-like protein 3 isoform X1 [Hippopotamus amphibius kiboko]|uniref:bolA-like protein 3 isoform X1 n=1 Tax=Hippopotamus amphibius kiboko TaxID=575201 RepID=UPI002598CEA8|nr:bolA-like protein 3 isoform X1 [Hippopotamus amphibius kiboko]
MAAWSPAAAAALLRGTRRLPLLHCAQRMFASQTEGELKVTQILKEKFPRATAIKVTDISGGCGAMYEIQIESEEFKEKRTVQQHQMVNQLKPDHINAQDISQRLSASASGTVTVNTQRVNSQLLHKAPGSSGTCL